jgi:hypothetical protein
MTEPKIAADFVNQLVDWSATRIQHTHTHTHTHTVATSIEYETKLQEEEETYIHVFDQREKAPISVWVLLKNTNSRAENSNGSQRAQTNGVQNTAKD